MELQTLTVSGEGTQQILFTNHALQDCRLPFHTAIVSKHWAKVSRDQDNDRGSDTSQASSPFSGHQVTTSCDAREDDTDPNPDLGTQATCWDHLIFKKTQLCPNANLILTRAPDSVHQIGVWHSPLLTSIRTWFRAWQTQDQIMASKCCGLVPYTTEMFWTHPLPMAAVLTEMLQNTSLLPTKC